MSFDATLAAIRFGTGLAPNIDPPNSIYEMLALLSGPDRAAAEFPIPLTAEAKPTQADFRRLARARREAADTDREDETKDAFRAAQQEVRLLQAKNMGQTLARGAHSQDGFRERLTRFWADHFTVTSRQGVRRHLVTPYVEEVIRPYLTGRFSEMLRGAVTHPMMLQYLDQGRSIGPNSERAKRRTAGLNENLAREVLELHTLGVGGGYHQDDVRQLAELFTGLSYSNVGVFRFIEDFAEPGSETILGEEYGGGDPVLEDIYAALDDIALHPDTARHLATKLAVHFVSDAPDAGMIEAMQARYLETDGELLSVYEAMLEHPAAWGGALEKVKQPFDYIQSSIRALGVPAEDITSATLREVRQLVYNPMRVMGQNWESPLGPDGWEEAAEAWITPQGMAGRISWGMAAPEKLVSRLPDPRDFVVTALGARAPQEVIFAAENAEKLSDGVGIVLASPAFQRR